MVEPLAEPADVGEVVRDAVASLEIPMGWTCASISSPPTRRSTAPGGTDRREPRDERDPARHGLRAVWVLVRSHDDGAEIVVEDQGPGVPEADRLTIFAPFRRGDTEAPGTGLGLAIVEGFVRLHGGRVWVEHRLGGGASFHVSFPGGGVAPALPEAVVTATLID